MRKVPDVGIIGQAADNLAERPKLQSLTGKNRALVRPRLVLTAGLDKALTFEQLVMMLLVSWLRPPTSISQAFRLAVTLIQR